MSAPPNDLFFTAEKLLGRTPADPEVQALLKAAGHWPMPAPDPEDDTVVDLESKSAGFSIRFRDASGLPHPSAAGKAAGTLMLTGCFFYAEGVEDYRSYGGALPHGISWSDTSASLVAKLGTPKNEITNKKTGKLSSQRWSLASALLTASYGDGGKVLRHLYLGLY